MDQKILPVIGKKFWKIVRVAYFMLRKGLSSKRKLMFDLNLLMKRGKIAGKAAFQNLMFQGHNNNNIHQSISKEYYEFSCSNSPAFHLPFNINKRINKHNQPEHDDVLMMNAAVLKALEMLQSETASPALPGFGRTPTVRQLRITDSPFH
uniref:Avr9/Cf-9 rapidly elicited protein 146 n=1 Tax=Solanum tuberosum TaxID=4113 RepID=M1BDC0_SOLTU